MLQGKCRSCTEAISFLYPAIEITTAALLSCLYLYLPHQYFLAYALFISALIVTIRSDIETMMISSFMTLYLVPVGCLLSWLNLLPISFTESIIGALVGYLFLYITNTIFKYIKQYDGIGEGDFDLLCFIGSFTGILGCWTAVTIGSAVGSLYGITILAYSYCNTSTTPTPLCQKIPFGPFLSLGALIYLFAQKWLFI